MRMSASTLAKWRMKGDGPRYVKIGAKVLYDDAGIDTWVASREFASTSEYEAV